MPGRINKTGLDTVTRKQLHATVKLLTTVHQDRTGAPPTSEQLIDMLRDRAQPGFADEFARIVARVRAERAAKNRG